MILIDGHTRLSVLLRSHPDALESIISLSPRFEKLRNPFLRKLMASRTSIEMACSIGSVRLEEFLSSMERLGFDVQNRTKKAMQTEHKNPPDFMSSLKDNQVISLDVIPVINRGSDPLKLILGKIESMKRDQVLKLTNSFEPLPLIHLLEKRGFQSYTELNGDGNYIIYFYKRIEAPVTGVDAGKSEDNWEELIESRKLGVHKMDVRALEMPLPMITILKALEELNDEQLLFVIHKRVPVFLLPELDDRNFKYTLREINENEVHMLIYKN